MELAVARFVGFSSVLAAFAARGRESVPRAAPLRRHGSTEPNTKGETMVRLTRIGLLSISFVVACGGSSGGPGRDVVAPTVMSTAPADGATGVLLQAAITATFSEDMSVDSLASDGLSLSPAVPGSVSYSGKTATFTPSAKLAYETTYKVTVKTSAKDMAGNPLKADFSWSFSTIAAPPAPIAVPGGDRDVNMGET